ncbi:hypothetical protein IMCC14465_16980 [alpha proteobacterium IMCC14465]|uniref:DUF3147 family protein n=1 Tax=alpha proteobacterium IMCC14465 TaxID=1220535 RepID=J9DEN5_9PROT|nr:hypothetical protein IMCC14465_16980 [alpha proteobacterium IMCC14465]
MFIILKVFLTAGIIVLITEIAKRSDKFGGLIAAMPLITIFAILWMYFEGVDNDKIAQHMRFNLFFVLPTLPVFFVFPIIINKYGFMTAFVASTILLVGLVYLFNEIYKFYGFRLF